MKPGRQAKRFKTSRGAQCGGVRRNATRLCSPEALEARALMAADGQHVGREHRLADGDVLELHT